MIIDLHAHCFPDELAPKAMAYLIEEAGGIRTYTEGTVSALKRSTRLSHRNPVCARKLWNRVGESVKSSVAAWKLVMRALRNRRMARVRKHART